MKLDGVTHEIDDDLAQSRRIHRHPARHFGRERADEVEIFLLALHRERAQSHSDQLGEIDFDGIERQLPGFDLREVEYVVDDPEERFRDTPAHLEVVRCSSVSAVSSARSVIPITPFHRRPDLMAHVREELTLHPSCFFRLLLERSDPLVRAPALLHLPRQGVARRGGPLELVDHAIEDAGQLADLVVGVNRDAKVEIASGHSLRGDLES